MKPTTVTLTMILKPDAKATTPGELLARVAAALATVGVVVKVVEVKEAQ